MLHAENVPLIFLHHAKNSPQLSDILRMMRNSARQIDMEYIPHDAEHIPQDAELRILRNSILDFLFQKVFTIYGCGDHLGHVT